MLEVKRQIYKKYFNCNNCGATNYESEWNDKIDFLTNIAAENGSGSYISLRLCDECLKLLFQEIKDIVDNIE